VLTYSRFVEKGVDIPFELTRPTDFTLLAFLIDWYFNPQKGLHGQAGIGPAALSRLKPDASAYTGSFGDRSFAFGGALMLGVGNEWWLDEHWGLGLLARVTTGVTTEKDDAGRRWYHVISASPTLMFSTTYR
jgi:hypothetical protein